MASRPYSRHTPHRGRHRRNPQFRPDRRPWASLSSLEAALAVIPTLPRPLLCQLTERIIARLDEIDGDPDCEPEDDRCSAGDDGVFSGAVVHHVADMQFGRIPKPGSDEDEEREQMGGDVPCLAVYDVEPDADGKREIIGYSGNGFIPRGEKRI